MTDRLPQLHLRRAFDHLPELVVPEGYELRSLTRDDWHRWTALMNENGTFGEWTLERSARLFSADSPLVFPASFFITKGGEPVGTAQLDPQTRPPYAPLAELGWVGVSPQHRGHGLAYVVCLAVMHGAKAAGYSSMFLRTEDFRLPAIRTYLKLGFEPWLFDPTAESRWRAIRQQLADYQRPPGNEGG